MISTIALQDQKSKADLQSFLTRAKRLDNEGAVRLRSFGKLLTVSVAPIYGTSIISGDPTILGMRIQELSSDIQTDSVVPISAVLERLVADSLEIPLPPTRVVVPWAGISPPQDGWRVLGEVAESELSEIAKLGIAEVAQAIPDNLGAALVQKVRTEVWGRGFGKLNLPAGVAFVASGLGFLTPGAILEVFQSGSWVRLSSPYGHVLVRN